MTEMDPRVEATTPSTNPLTSPTPFETWHAINPTPSIPTEIEDDEETNRIITRYPGLLVSYHNHQAENHPPGTVHASPTPSALSQEALISLHVAESERHVAAKAHHVAAEAWSKAHIAAAEAETRLKNQQCVRESAYAVYLKSAQAANDSNEEREQIRADADQAYLTAATKVMAQTQQLQVRKMRQQAADIELKEVETRLKNALYEKTVAEIKEMKEKRDEKEKENEMKKKKNEEKEESKKREEASALAHEARHEPVNWVKELFYELLKTLALIITMHYLLPMIP
ncbi:hypothetical protein P280DRAFT_548973 [Massarina eburnea CBS 473.64]|uniref:Uncharacterized protein n=1 Tax=Massarina eburnea CBS 473.64 TaxID=1395130 RepID=A0A6A6S272_9PLEO|nr:hypothetical protein P280DRAFT_548973 [Massarina eburnea CBS 473.64]